MVPTIALATGKAASLLSMQAQVDMELYTYFAGQLLANRVDLRTERDSDSVTERQ